MNRIGIICALYSEATCFTAKKLALKKPVTLHDRALLIVSGTGNDNAKQAAQRLVEENVGCLISFGSAGALSSALRPGHLIYPQEVTGHGKRYDATSRLSDSMAQRLSRKNMIINTGPLMTVAEVIKTRAGKRELFEQTGAVSVDMETACILDVARSRQVPAFALRVIADGADLAIPGVVLRRTDEFGRINTLPFIIDLARRPGQIPNVLRLGKAWYHARKTMKLVAHGLSLAAHGEALNQELKARN